MIEITSVNNPLVKSIAALKQKKERDLTNKFLLEGQKGVQEALSANLTVDKIFINKNFSFEIEGLPQGKIIFTDEKVLKKISSTESPPPIIGIFFKKEYTLEDIFKEKNPLIIVIENIKDPGNLGTIVRTAIAANFSGIVLLGSSVDIYNPKVVRSAVGNLWKIPIIELQSADSFYKTLTDNNFQKLATVVKDGVNSKNYNDIDYRMPTFVMFGSEAEGLSEELTMHADSLIKIPMNPEVESLNLSISVGIIAYEAYRQRGF